MCIISSYLSASSGLCGKGYYREPNSINCTLCPIGEYQNSSNSTSATACTPCPLNTTTFLEGAPEESYCISKLYNKHIFVHIFCNFSSNVVTCNIFHKRLLFPLNAQNPYH